MATILFGSTLSNLITTSGLASVTDQTRFPFETSWITADNYVITAFGNDLSLDATGTYHGTAEDIRISDSSGNLLLVLRGVNVPLFPLTSGFDTANFLNGDDLIDGGVGRNLIDGGAGTDTVTYETLSGSTQFIGDPVPRNTGVDLDLAAGTAKISFTSGHFTTTTVDTLVSIENAIGTLYDDKLAGNDGDNLIRGFGGNDLIYGRDGVDTLDGGDGNDILFGGNGVDKIYGGNGNDDLYGENGKDIIFGNDGVDFITGGRGQDTMTGGAGVDYFNYDSIVELGNSATTRDIITDFTHGADQIGLADIDANSHVSGNQAFHFAGYGTAFTCHGGELRYYRIDLAGTANDKTIVQGDINGDHKADFQIELSGLKVLSAGDFIL